MSEPRAENPAERLRAFHRAFSESVTLPLDATVIGETVSVIAIEFDERCAALGLRATCRRAGGFAGAVAACDLAFPEGTAAARIVAEYRRWLGLGPIAEGEPASGSRRQPAEAHDLDVSRPVELAVLSVRPASARGRVLGKGSELTLRASGVWRAVPGEILSVRGKRQWRYKRHDYLSGEILRHRVDIAALGLVPLRLEERGLWKPSEQSWGTDGDPLADWAAPIAARGPRPVFEMEQVLPGSGPDAPGYDPISEAVDLRHSGVPDDARHLLMSTLVADLRCLDAHAHLGVLEFDGDPARALRHFEIGVKIGELSLAGGGLEPFAGLLPWGWIDNRPFLLCLHGYGLCLWRLGRHGDAAKLFEKMLWLNPTDNHGARFLLPDVRAGASWSEEFAKR